ncbi:MAG: hypothetical protein ACRD6R_04050 [Candidatus Polarisedimenticolia bacterium]
MTRSAATGLAHSIQARLKNAATQTGRPFPELLELYAVERFLHRLGRSEVQRRPELFPILRVLVDRRKRPARFLIVALVYPGAKRYTPGERVEAVPFDTLAAPGGLFPKDAG